MGDSAAIFSVGNFLCGGNVITELRAEMDKVIKLAQLFNIPNGYVILTGVSLAVLVAVCWRRQKNICNAVLYPAIGVVVCVTLPFLPMLLDRLVRTPERYVRIYWILPIVLILGIAAVYAGELGRGQRERCRMRY